MQLTLLTRLGPARGWVLELALAAVGLGVGFGLMPLCIFLAGSTLLGRYDNGTAARLYDAVYAGLSSGSSASWTVVLGPYGFYLLFKLLRLCWRAGARAA